MVSKNKTNNKISADKDIFYSFLHLLLFMGEKIFSIYIYELHIDFFLALDM